MNTCWRDFQALRKSAYRIGPFDLSPGAPDSASQAESESSPRTAPLALLISLLYLKVAGFRPLLRPRDSPEPFKDEVGGYLDVIHKRRESFQAQQVLRLPKRFHLSILWKKGMGNCVSEAIQGI